MKSHFVRLLFLLFLFLKISNTYAQRDYPFAICKNGSLLGGYNKSLHSIPDTISKEDAKSIFMIDGIWIQKDGIAKRIKIKEFQMTIQNRSDSVTIKSNSPYLTDEMKKKLSELKPETKLYFEGIVGTFSENKDMVLTLLSFLVK